MVVPVTAPNEQAARVPWLDRLRGIAAIGMVVVHVTHAVLRDDLRATPGFRIADMAFGLVAPAFLFCVGASFALRPSGALRPRLLRAGGLFVLGYVMHASGLIGYVRTGAADELALFFQSDILQVIACALAILAALATVAPIRWPWAAIFIGALALGVGPFIGDVGAHAPAPIAPYLTVSVATQFPLFPWLSYALVAAGGCSLTGRAGSAEGARLVLASGAGIAALVLLFLPLPPHDRYRTGPANAALRFASVAFLGWAMGRARLPPRLDAFLALLGRRSLFLYVVHVALVYGRHPLSLRSRIGPALGVPGVVLAVIATLVAMTLLTWAWDAVLHRTSVSRHRVRS